jgi:UDP-N-acetyl-2-amino-2-deoxyglucuronate dehydrogenase
MNVGLIGTGAIAELHARAYRNIGYRLRVCTSRREEIARQFAARHDAEVVATMAEVCAHPEVDFVDVCTLPDVRLEPVRLCAHARKHVQVQKPIAMSPVIAREMVDTAAEAGILLHVVSQHRFDESSIFLASAIEAGRLGRLLECDAYVKWFRTDAYYARPGKGTWSIEGGGALINQGIHQVDLLQWLAGPVEQVTAMWQLGAAHAIESEDVVSAIVRYAGGATGVIQAATAFRPGYPERMEFHGTRGSAIVTGDRLTAWDVESDEGPPAPVSTAVASGASDPMAISVESFEKQFRDFGDAITQHRQPLVSGEAGLRALDVVDAIYRSCRTGERIVL